ncbi:uncharacterized protein [Leptinotarsa decemlineata]|uniref:uncharacterized protein n=1 Tax=Leptinotarsa decemlineata TaxID=7539 RepID=UPI003D308270
MAGKLEYYGIRGGQLNLFKSYLVNRKARVHWENEVSDFVAMEHGVPQGSTTSRNILDLNVGAETTDAADRICSYLINFEGDENGNDEEEDEEEDEENETEDENVDDARKNANEDESSEDKEKEKDDNKKKRGKDVRDKQRPSSTTVQHEVRKPDTFSLTFRDIEDSIRLFDGKDSYPVKTWIQDFEEIAEITGWNELQKLIFAKKSLRGLAKLFVQSERGITTWAILKKRLIKEFEVKVSSAQIHKLLMTRKKKYDESVQEYVLAMREIGNRANIEDEVIIQYITEGIQDETTYKVVLYGASNFAEFKEKVKVYDQIQNQKKKSFPGSSNWKSKNENTRKERQENHSTRTDIQKTETCFNCGQKGHKSKRCPNKAKGTKCFSCNNFGHISTRCPNKASTSNSATTRPSTSTDTANVSVVEVIPKNAVDVTINNVVLAALFDTGSDLCTVREDVYKEAFQDIELSKDTLIVKGLGEGSRVNTLGSFKKQVMVNDEEFYLEFHVLPIKSTAFKVIVGNNILKEAEVSINEDGIMIYRKEKGNFLMQMTIVDVDVRHIKNEEYKEKVVELVENYKPQKIETTGIEMKIILKSEEPIYQRPRRLSVPEKEEVDKQIDEWLRDGIVQPSSSDFASPIVIVRKKDGQARICCDYRLLNKHVIKDRFPLPLIEDVLDKLQGASVYSTIDLRNGFFHVSVEPNSVKYTSFVTPTGQFEFLKCPFGFCNSPAVFQRFISYIFRPLTSKDIAIYYMDDIIITSRDEEQGVERLRLVLEIAKNYGLDIKKKKCQFLKRRVEF